MKISGKYSHTDWFALKAKIQSAPTSSLWNSAYTNFYRKRITTRYLNQIKSINNTQNREGFAIVTMFCALIEFLESCERGDNFRLTKKGDPPQQPNEYNQYEASEYFKNFLKNRELFKTLVPTALIGSFYADVRCALLHEARTKGTWLISSKQSKGDLIKQNQDSILLYRKQLFPSLKTYFDDYRARLITEQTTQEAFIRKFDYLCIP